MSQSIDIKDLIAYLNQNLDENRKEEVEKYLIKNPEYFKILKGLSNLQDNIDENQSLEEYLENQKEDLKKKLFPN